MSVRDAVNGQAVRRRLVAKQPAPPQLVSPVVKRRWLSAKQPVPALCPPPPVPVVAILPIGPYVWGDLSRDTFDEHSHMSWICGILVWRLCGLGGMGYGTGI